MRSMAVKKVSNLCAKWERLLNKCLSWGSFNRPSTHHSINSFSSITPSELVSNAFIIETTSLDSKWYLDSIWPRSCTRANISVISFTSMTASLFVSNSWKISVKRCLTILSVTIIFLWSKDTNVILSNCFSLGPSFCDSPSSVGTIVDKSLGSNVSLNHMFSRCHSDRWTWAKGSWYRPWSFIFIKWLCFLIFLSITIPIP